MEAAGGCRQLKAARLLLLLLLLAWLRPRHCPLPWRHCMLLLVLLVLLLLYY